MEQQIQHSAPVTARQNGCPVCGHRCAGVFMEVPGVPIYNNVHWNTAAEAVHAPRGDIRLGFCEQCGHIWNRVFDPSRMDYDQNYENSLHFSPRFLQYVESLALRLVEQYDLHEKDIIEIGCGKGEFLELLCELGRNRGVGFDKSYETRSVNRSVADRIRFVEDYYTDRYRDILADIICCRHVLEHVPAPRDFLGRIREIIGGRTGTVLYFEVPNAAFTLRQLGIWDLIYEHCSYFSEQSLTHLFGSSGFHVVRQAETFAGQFLSLEAFPKNGAKRRSEVGKTAIDALARDVEAFGERYRKKVAQWQAEMDRMAKARQRAVVWGAGSKGITFLNVIDCGGLVQHIVDLNPRKQDRYVAGSGQQIVAPAYLAQYKPDVIIAMNPVYVNEIKHCLDNMNLSPRVLTA